MPFSLSGSTFRVWALRIVILAGCAPVHAQTLELTSADEHIAPVGTVAIEGDALVLRGEPGVEQAVVLWPGLELEAEGLAYAHVDHDGLAPSHALSLYFRASDGTHIVDVPQTSGGATVALAAAQGWRGRITEIGLVYGPQGNIPTLVESSIRVHGVTLAPPSFGARFAAAWSSLWRIAPWLGSRNHVLARNTLVASAGVIVALALLAAAIAPRRGRRFAFTVALAAFVLVEFAVWRQWLVLRDETSAIASARAAAGVPPELDWQLVRFAEGVRRHYEGREHELAFALGFDDSYVSDRLRFHLLPLRARRDIAYVPPAGVCLLKLGDEEVETPLLRRETAFGAVVLSLPADAGPECGWISSRSSP